MQDMKIEDGNLIIGPKDCRISINLYAWFEGLDVEERREVANALTWDEIFKQACDRLTGEGDFWAGDDGKVRLDFLAHAENAMLTRYKWSALEELIKKLKNIVSHEHIYWKLYHEPDSHLQQIFSKWLSKHNINSNYTTELPDIESFRTMIDEMFIKLKKECDRKSPEVICLCGSTRFMKAYNEARKRLTYEGKIVLSVEIVTTQTRDEDPQHINLELKAMLDKLHLRKIDMSDRVLVLNVTGYIGESTRAEIAYAEKIGKPIDYLEEIA